MDSTTDKRWDKLPEESAEDYIERVGGWDAANMHMRGVLEKQFGMPETESKEFSLRSKSWWARFFTEELARNHAKGRDRKWAVRFVQRRVDYPQIEVDAIVDAVGDWRQ